MTDAVDANGPSAGSLSTTGAPWPEAHSSSGHIDGALPNLALMKLMHWHRASGDEVHFYRSVERDLFEPTYDRVYGSVIFDFSAARLARFRTTWPDAIIGGTGAGRQLLGLQVEDVIGRQYERYDYAAYPEFGDSIGFTQRGCRLNCGFCVVRAKEGRPRPINSVADIWRGEPWPKRLRLLDNDFFGQPREHWQARVREVRDGGFRVNITDIASASFSTVTEPHR